MLVEAAERSRSNRGERPHSHTTSRRRETFSGYETSAKAPPGSTGLASRQGAMDANELPSHRQLNHCPEISSTQVGTFGLLLPVS